MASRLFGMAMSAVKTGKVQSEQMFSALPLKADIEADIVFVRSVPKADIVTHVRLTKEAANCGGLLPGKLGRRHGGTITPNDGWVVTKSTHRSEKVECLLSVIVQPPSRPDC